MRRKLGPSIVVVVVAAVVVLLVYGLTQQGESRALDNAIATNHPLLAPDASRSLPVLDRIGTSRASLRRWRGKVVVINFWAKWCDTCLDEAPLIERAQRALARSGAGTVVGIDYKDVSSQALQFVSQEGLSYPNLRDINGSFGSAYGTDALPETFVLDRHMRVVALMRGEVPGEGWLTAAVAHAERT
ncbi:MAG TPA: TlpA disulfide reductase family protein [Solirubrobacteraceae bacterium]